MENCFLYNLTWRLGNLVQDRVGQCCCGIRTLSSWVRTWCADWLRARLSLKPDNVTYSSTLEPQKCLQIEQHIMTK